MRPRPFVLPLFLGFTVGAAPAAAEAPERAAPATNPNVVLILADDLGWGDVGAMHPESAIPTPHIDRLAGEGMRFVDAHAPAAVCTPTRYALLTGRYTWRTRLTSGVLGQPHPRFRGRTGLGEYGDWEGDPGIVAQTDDAVGEVLAALDRNRVRDKTLVIFTSDNGSYMYRLDDAEPDHVDDPSVQGYRVGRHRSNAGWRGTKADVWEGGHRVPFVVRWPGVVEAGSETAATVAHTDLYATLADIVGTAPAPDAAEDSVSMLPMLRGETATRGVAVVHHSSGGMFAIRDGPWKLVLGNGSGGRQAPRGEPFARPYQLFDLSRDPAEGRDVATENPEVVERLEATFERLRRDGRSAPRHAR